MPDDNQNPNLDPWAQRSNTIGNNSPDTVSAEGLAREAKWSQAMSDVAPFAGESPDSDIEQEAQSTNAENTGFDEKISQASRILRYVNEAPMGLDDAMDVLEHFNPTDYMHPWTELKKQLGIMDEEYDSSIAERQDFINSEHERNDILQKHNFMASENAPDIANQVSRQDFDYALQQVKSMIAEIKSGNSSKHKDLNSNAVSAGMGQFSYLTKDEEHKDIATLFNAISNAEESNESENTDAEDASATAEDIMKDETEPKDNPVDTIENPEDPENPQNILRINH